MGHTSDMIMMIWYTYFHNRHERNGQAEYTQPHILDERIILDAHPTESTWQAF